MQNENAGDKLATTVIVNYTSLKLLTKTMICYLIDFSCFHETPFSLCLTKMYHVGVNWVVPGRESYNLLLQFLLLSSSLAFI